MLEKAGHAIDVVEDGAAAIEAVRTEQYDLVLMDVQMPLVDLAGELSRRGGPFTIALTPMRPSG